MPEELPGQPTPKDVPPQNAAGTEPKKPPQDGEDAKRNGILGVAVIVLSNIAAFTGSIEKVNEQVQKIQEQLHLGATPYLLYVVLGIIFLGYLLTSTSLYKHLKGTVANRFPTRQFIIGGLIFLSMGTLYVLNVSAFSRSSDIILQGRKNVWIDKVRGTQGDNGGLSIMLWNGLGNPPQVFTTAQGLTAMMSAMDWDKPQDKDIQAIRAGFNYIDAERSPLPDQCWGYFGASQCLTEIAGWVTLGRVRALEHADLIWPSESDREKQLSWVQHDLDQLMTHYIASENAWSPYAPAIAGPAADKCASLPKALSELSTQPPTRTYSTVMALWALLEAHRVAIVRARLAHKYDAIIRNGIGWLLVKYSTEQGSWVPNPHRPNQREDYLGLTAQTMNVLYQAAMQDEFKNAVDQPRWKTVRQDFLKKQIKQQFLGDNSHLSDMDGYVFPYPQPLEPMTFLWAPWSLAAYRHLSNDKELSDSDRKLAQANLEIIAGDYQGQVFEKVESGGTYELAENLLCVSDAFPRSAH